jgi:hypothetical protein
MAGYFVGDIFCHWSAFILLFRCFSKMDSQFLTPAKLKPWVPPSSDESMSEGVLTPSSDSSSGLDMSLIMSKTGKPAPDMQSSNGVDDGNSIGSEEAKVTMSSASYKTVASVQSTKTSSANSIDSFLADKCQTTRAYNSTKRKLKSHQVGELNAKRRRLMSDDDIVQALRTKCCRTECLQSFTLDAFTEERERYVCKSQKDSNTDILTLIRTAINTGEKRNGQLYYHLSTGHWVCAKACALVCGVSRNKFSGLKVKVLKDRAQKWTRKLTSHERGLWQGVVIPWIQSLAQLFGNDMPDNGKIELSVGNKIQIYQKFVVAHESLPEFKDINMLTLSWFYTLWNRYVPHVITPKENRFSKCDTCELFKSHLESSATHAQRVKWVAQFDLHLEEQMIERKQYYKNREHARNHPDEALSCIIDGAAQGLHRLPFFGKSPPKAVFGKPHLDLHVMGVLVHKYGPWVYLHDDSTRTGPNLVMECLYRTLCQIPVDKLPPLLYLQLDNTASDNKNHHVLEFASWLVESGVFKEVVFFSLKIF